MLAAMRVLPGNTRVLDLNAACKQTYNLFGGTVPPRGRQHFSMLRAATLALSLALIVLAGLVRVKAGTSSTTISYQQLEFTIQPGSTRPPIPVPAVNQPIHMMVAMTTAENRGVGEVTLLRTPRNANPMNEFLGVGLDIESNVVGACGLVAGRPISAGYSSTAGTHIIYADYCGNVDVQFASAKQIQIYNNASGGFWLMSF